MSTAEPELGPPPPERRSTAPTSVLAVGSHPDDVELGCGGALVKHAAAGDRVTLLVVSDGEAGPGPVWLRRAEQQASAALLGAEVVYGSLPDGQLGNREIDLVHLIERLIRERAVNCVYTHGRDDTHQDHRAVAVATWGAARRCARVLSYESPSSVAFAPSVFIDISDALEKKVAALECHASQVGGSAMADVDMVRSVASFRGFQARTRAAEGFIPHRLVMDL